MSFAAFQPRQLAGGTGIVLPQLTISCVSDMGYARRASNVRAC